MPNSCTIHKTKTTNQIIFISLNRNIHTNQFTTSLSTSLLHRERLTITRETRNKRWVKNTGLNNFFNIVEVTKLDESIIFIRNKILFQSRKSSRRRKTTFYFLNLFLCHFQVPLTTSNLIFFKIFCDSLIGTSITSTPTTNVGTSNF